MMDPLILIGSLTAVLAVAALVHFMKLGETAIESETHAMRLAEDNLSGFTAEAAIVSQDGKAAIVRGTGNTVALVKRHGAQFAMREVKLPLILKQDGKATIVDSGEKRFGRVTLSLPKQHADKLLTWV